MTPICPPHTHHYDHLAEPEGSGGAAFPTAPTCPQNDAAPVASLIRPQVQTTPVATPMCPTHTEGHDQHVEVKSETDEDHTKSGTIGAYKKGIVGVAEREAFTELSKLWHTLHRAKAVFQ